MAVDALLGIRASVDTQETRLGYTPLLLAAEAGHAGVVQTDVEAQREDHRDDLRQRALVRPKSLLQHQQPGQPA